MIKLLSFVLLFIPACLTGQVDLYQAAKNLEGASFHELNDWVDRSLDNDTDICKFYYYWTAQHIRYDRNSPSSFTSVNEDLAARVMKSRQAVCAGYAKLYQEFLRGSGIRCEIIDGVSKTTENIFEITPYREDHSWNAIQLNGGWHLVDVTWASTTARDRQVDDFYFMTDPGIFILDHFPVDPSWQLLNPVVTYEEFKHFPCYSKKYFQLGFGDYLNPVLEKRANGSYQIALGISSDWTPVPVWVDRNDSHEGDIDYEISRNISKGIQTILFRSRKKIIRIDAVRQIGNMITTEIGIAYFELDSR